MNIIFYKLQDEVNDVKKTRTLTATSTYTPLTISGKLRNSTSKISPVIDFAQEITYFNNYNYAYIADFGRYYFVDNVISVRENVTSISFRVDVLTSFLTQANITGIEGLVGRCANSNHYNKYIPDSNVQFVAEKYVSIAEPTSYTSNIENVTFSLNATYNIVISTTNIAQAPAYQDISIPSDLQFLTGTATIEKDYFRPIGNALCYVTDNDDYFEYGDPVIQIPALPLFLTTCAKKENAQTVVNNILLFPFSLERTVVRNDVYILEDPIVIVPGTNLTMKKAKQNNSGYLVLKDFILSQDSVSHYSDNFTKYEPYTSCEIFIPFVGWTSIDIKKNLGCRLMVIYNVDYTSGQSNVLLINKTRNEVVTQTTVQLGVQVPVNTTNLKENELKDQNYTRSYYAGLLASVATTAVGAGLVVSGYGTGAGIAMMASGVMMTPKTFVSYVNNENLLIDKAQGQTVPSNAMFGSMSGLKVLVKWTKSISVNYDTTTQQNDLIKHLGVPTNKVLTLSQIPTTDYHTYCEIVDLHTTTEAGTYSIADITIPETEELKTLCSQGIYL